MFSEQNISGQVFSTLEKLMFVYGKALFDALSQGFLTLLGVFAVIYIISKVFKSTLLEGKFSFNEIITTPLIIASVCTALLSSFAVLQNWIFKPCYDLAVNLTLQAVKATYGSSHVTSIVDMLNLIEQELDTQIFSVTKRMLADTGILFHVPGMFACLIINAPFMFVWVLFVALMVDCLFKFVSICAISPLLIITYPFKALRGISIAGLRILFNAILTMFFSGIAMGFTLAIMRLSDLSPIKDDRIVREDWFFSKAYWALFLVGCISILFHLKAPRIAANLASIDDGAGAAAAVAGFGSPEYDGGQRYGHGGCWQTRGSSR